MKEKDLQLPLKLVAQDMTTPGLVWVFDSKEKGATRYRFHENHAHEIIRAVNSHAALVSALEECKHWHQGDKWRHSDDPEQKGAWNRHMQIIDSALALAKGE